ncbi:MAG: PEP-CTERM sorting domain-containing protein [Pirellulales bacterium]
MLFALACVGLCPQAGANTLFWEDFNGIKSYPSTDSHGDEVNNGLPTQAKGADEFWYGGRFQAADGGSIDSDLATQRYGGGPNKTPVGRVEDEAGLLFKISTLDCETVSLSFDWRTLWTQSGDRLRVGYFIGQLDFGSGRYLDFNTLFGSTWFGTNWTQLLAGNNSSFQHQVYALPPGQASVWVAFWLDGGEGNQAKIDNIHVECTEVVPEPSSLLLAGVGAASVALAIRRRRGRQSLRQSAPR